MTTPELIPDQNLLDVLTKGLRRELAAHGVTDPDRYSVAFDFTSLLPEPPAAPVESSAEDAATRERMLELLGERLGLPRAVWTRRSGPAVQRVPFKRRSNIRIAWLEHSQEAIYAHAPARCAGSACTLHNRSDHRMRHLPQHWRSDRGIMERICAHGVGHIDPDDVTTDRTHGCCVLRCCAPPTPEWVDDAP